MGYVSLQEGKSFFLETLQGPLEFKTPPIAGPGSKSLGLYMRFSHQLGFSTFIPPMAIGLLRFFTRNIYIYISMYPTVIKYILGFATVPRCLEKAETKILTPKWAVSLMVIFIPWDPNPLNKNHQKQTNPRLTGPFFL